MKNLEAWKILWEGTDTKVQRGIVWAQFEEFGATRAAGIWRENLLKLKAAAISDMMTADEDDEGRRERLIAVGNLEVIDLLLKPYMGVIEAPEDDSDA